MRVIVCEDTEQTGQQVAGLIEQEVRVNPELVMALATGRTASRAYADLVVRYHDQNDLTFKNVRCFNSDEYVGLGPNNPRSTRFFMNTRLYHHIDIRMENTHAPVGDAVDLEAACKSYELLIKSFGGLDLVVLGLGYNGHVGFNEPGSSIKSRTRIVDFTDSTLAALSDGYRFRNLTETPSKAIAIGLATLLEAKHVIICAAGIGKAEAAHRLIDCKASASVPASQLALHHHNLTVVLDEDAATKVQTPLTDEEAPT
ncbi:MAG: glucosamine-6-phosphate deaminase [Planctomycetota bacterium]